MSSKTGVLYLYCWHGWFRKRYCQYVAYQQIRALSV